MRPDTTRRVSLPLFFGLTFFLSWLIWIPLVLSRFQVGPFRISNELGGVVRLLGVLMPGISAIVLTASVEGGKSLGAMLRRLFIGNVGIRYWLAAVLLYPALLGVTALVYAWVGATPPIGMPQPTASGLVSNIVILLVAAAGEEVGWRGLALPSLQRKRSPLVSSLILGLLWATWQLPFWMLQDTYASYRLWYLALNYLYVVPLTLFITWLFNRTRSSILMAVVFSFAFNIVNVALLPVTVVPLSYGFFIALQALIVLFALRRGLIERPRLIERPGP